MPSLDAIRAALADASAVAHPPDATMAAVAMILAGEPTALELCFILRATRAGDRWSGQMAFPGGRAEPGDPTAQAVAIREAREEVGVRLDEAEALGSLPAMPLSPAAMGELRPFVFYVGRRPVPLHPNHGEVAEAYWIPLRHLWDGGQRGTIDWEWQGQVLRFPGIRYGEHLIWGLTHRVLTQWAEQLGRPLPGAGEPPFVPIG